MPAPRLILCVLACAALAGCGKSEEDKVRDAVQGYADATARKDYQRLCDEVLSRELVARVRARVPCEVALKIGLEDVRKPTVTVLSVTVDGDRATVRVRSGAEGQTSSDDTVQLVQQGGDWRIDSLGGEDGGSGAPAP